MIFTGANSLSPLNVVSSAFVYSAMGGYDASIGGGICAGTSREEEENVVAGGEELISILECFNHFSRLFL